MIITLDSIKLENSFTPSEIYGGRVLLFLDFDGVLHEYEQGHKREKNKIFTKNHYIEKILREMPNVHVVVSSSWTKTCTLNILKQKFAEDVRHRFIGILHEHTDNRSEDIRTYLKSHGEEFDPWIAVDDLAKFYDNDPIVRTSYKTGLTDETYNVLKNALLSPIEYKESRK